MNEYTGYQNNPAKKFDAELNIFVHINDEGRTDIEKAKDTLLALGGEISKIGIYDVVETFYKAVDYLNEILEGKPVY